MRKASHEHRKQHLHECSPTPRPEPLEARRLLSVAVDLSLQGVLWTTPPTKSASATIVPFRIDAVRVLGTAVDPHQIDGASTSTSDSLASAVTRIDGVLPPGMAAPADDALLFSQIDLGSTFLTRPFDQDPATQDVSKKKGEQSPRGLPGSTSIDWSRFELFEDVTFTFNGNQIQAGLPTADGTVSVNIVVQNFPPGMPASGTFSTGTGDFLARLESLTQQPPASDPTPGGEPAGNGPLGLGDGGGDASPTPPTPAAGAPGSPTPIQPSVEPVNPAPAGSNSDRPGSRETANEQIPAVSTSSTLTLTSADRDTTGRFGSTPSVFVLSVAAGKAGGVTSLGKSTPPSQAGGDAATIVLPAGATVDAPGGWTQYLVVAAGTQLSTLSGAVQRLFGEAGAMAVPEAQAPPIIDYDALRRTGRGVALGLSPWQMVVRQPEGVSPLWKTTAGVSLVVAVGGYMYCREYTRRRRQEQQLASCRATADLRRTNGRAPSEGDPHQAHGAHRMLVARISRLWRDEFVE